MNQRFQHSGKKN